MDNNYDLEDVKRWLYRVHKMRVITEAENANRNKITGWYVHTPEGKEALRASGYIHQGAIRKRLAEFGEADCDRCRRLANAIMAL